MILPSVLWRCWLGGRKGIRPVKNWGAGVVVWSEVQTCIRPSWCHCHSLSLASVKSRLVLPFWYRLTRLVPEKRPLNVWWWWCYEKYYAAPTRISVYVLTSVVTGCVFVSSSFVDEWRSRDDTAELSSLLTHSEAESSASDNDDDDDGSGSSGSEQEDEEDRSSHEAADADNSDDSHEDSDDNDDDGDCAALASRNPFEMLADDSWILRDSVILRQIVKQLCSVNSVIVLCSIVCCPLYCKGLFVGSLFCHCLWHTGKLIGRI